MFASPPQSKLVLQYCLVVAIIDAIVLYAYHAHDPYKNVERFYFNRSKIEYGILKGGYFIVFITFMISVKVLLSHLLFGRMRTS